VWVVVVVEAEVEEEEEEEVVVVVVVVKNTEIIEKASSQGLIQGLQRFSGYRAEVNQHKCKL
jgi:hypothetical protein